MSGLTRRDVLKTSAAIAGLPLALHAQSEAEPNNRITDIFFDLANIYKWDGSDGDTWDPFWPTTTISTFSIATGVGSEKSGGISRLIVQRGIVPGH